MTVIYGSAVIARKVLERLQHQLFGTWCNKQVGPEKVTVGGSMAESNVLCGLHRCTSGKEFVCQAGRLRKDPWRRKWQPTPVFLPGKS